MTSKNEFDALLIVDPQNDFCSGGSLAVPDGERIMDVLNPLIRALDLPVYVSRDWHPPSSAHFERWPSHCVQNTPGAAFHPALELPTGATVITKGTDPNDDSGYSAFEGVDAEGSPLADALHRDGIRHLLVGGLATDYCVRASVLGALERGLEVTVVADAVAGIDAQAGDVVMAVSEMTKAGASFVNSRDLLGPEQAS